MLNKDNYISWSSHLLRYAKRKPNGKLLVKFILEGAYKYRIIEEPGDPYRTPPVTQFSHLHTDDEPITTEANAKEIWLRVQQMMKGNNIGVQEKEAELLNEVERFTSTVGNRLNHTIIVSQSK
ncbi:hypothetical protein Tco_0694576 [Tanacetum coccineum]